MVKFGDLSVIRTAIDACFKRFHVVTHVSDNQILVTEGTHVATIYDVSTRSSLRSWCFPESNPLSAPVIFDETLNEFVAVQQSSVIICFEMNDDISAASKVKLNQGVYCVFRHRKCGTIVLFKNGCVKSLNQLKQKNSIEASEFVLKSNENIVWAKMICLNEDEVIIILVSEIENGSCIHEINFNTSNETVVKTSNALHSQKYSFFTIDEEKKLLLGLDSKNSLLNLRDEELVLKFPSDYRNCVNSITSMSSNKLLVTVRTKSEHDAFKLQIWDLNFKLVISEINLDLVPLNNAIGIHESSIFVCCSKGITIIPFDLKNVSLASVLGKATTVEDRPAENETDLQEISKKVAFSAPQERERLQALALNIALKSSDSVDTKTLMDVLKYPFCENFAIKNLKTYKYSVEEVVKLLELLNISLNEVNKLFVVDWMSATIDAYFKQLILTSNQKTAESLKNILKAVDNICEYCEKLQDLRYLVEEYGLSNNLTHIPRFELPKYNVGHYCIEIVYF